MATRPATGSRFLALVVLVAFLLQSIAVDTHVHPAGPQSFGPKTDVAVALPAHGPLKNLKTAPDACRLCQEIAHAGVYIVPAAILPAALLGMVAWWPVRENRISPVAAFAFIWRSRGPPLS